MFEEKLKLEKKEKFLWGSSVFHVNVADEVYARPFENSNSVTRFD